LPGRAAGISLHIMGIPIVGSCHCKNFSFVLDWSPEPSEIPARACSCSFCMRHGGVWTACPTGSLKIAIKEPERTSKYSFDTKTADFHICSICGLVPIVTSRIDGRLFAVVNVNLFDGVDPAPLWNSYLEAGWTELTDQENAVELAIVLEQLGRTTDPTPLLATLTQFAPLVGDRFDPLSAGAAVYGGVSAVRDAEGWVLTGTDRFVLDGDRAQRLAVVTPAGVFLVDAATVTTRRVDVFDPVLHVAEVSVAGVHVAETDRLPVDTERARHVALMGMAITRGHGARPSN